VSIGGNLHPIGLFPHNRPQNEVLFKKRLLWSKKSQGVNPLPNDTLAFACDFSGQLAKALHAILTDKKKPGKITSIRKVV
jgi:hypothetical protein